MVKSSKKSRKKVKKKSKRKSRRIRVSSKATIVKAPRKIKSRTKRKGFLGGFFNQKKRNVKRISPQTSKAIARKDFEAFEFGVQKLKELEKELNSLNARKFPDEEASIRSKLKNVSQLPAIEREMGVLRKKISGKYHHKIKKIHLKLDSGVDSLVDTHFNSFLRDLKIALSQRVTEKEQRIDETLKSNLFLREKKYKEKHFNLLREFREKQDRLSKDFDENQFNLSKELKEKYLEMSEDFNKKKKSLEDYQIKLEKELKEKHSDMSIDFNKKRKNLEDYKIKLSKELKEKHSELSIEFNQKNKDIEESHIKLSKELKEKYSELSKEFEVKKKSLEKYYGDKYELDLKVNLQKDVAERFNRMLKKKLEEREPTLINNYKKIIRTEYAKKYKEKVNHIERLEEEHRQQHKERIKKQEDELQRKAKKHEEELQEKLKRILG